MSERSIDLSASARPVQEDNPHRASCPPIDVHPRSHIRELDEQLFSPPSQHLSGSINDENIRDLVDGPIAPRSISLFSGSEAFVLEFTALLVP